MKNFYSFIFFLISIIWVEPAIFAQTTSFKILSDELQQLQKQLVPDSRVAILNIEISDTLQLPIVIKGETNLYEAKQQIIRILSDRRVEFVDSIRILPDATVGEKNWALVNLSVANLRAKPGDASELVSQVLMGTPMKVLDYKNKWYRVQTPEYYIGWMDSGGLIPKTFAELSQWNKTPRWVYRQVNGFVYNSPDDKVEIVSDIVLGDLFIAEKAAKNWLRIRFPDGRNGFVKQEDCLPFPEWVNLNSTAGDILKTARQMMGFPYLWGGTSTKGIDCSGFVKTAFYRHGIILARDASQQAKYGEVVDFSKIENLQPGDLLFFGRSAQRVTHVGIYISNGDFIHSSGRVHIGSIIPGDPKNDPARNLVAVRRVMNYSGSEGIVPVKNHQWYNR
ncbi:MAG TPA: hypothetical protein DER09_07360 [Prolixibacteraceae bacterium]|nr:hypothetical protein [Prolixibacteraceae bacterium]